MNTTTKVDMTYSFLRDDEPTDEQLQVIMQEVAEEARRNQEETAKQLRQSIEYEIRRAALRDQRR